MGLARKKKKRDSSKNKEWQEFEKLIYRIERLYCPDGGEIKFDDHIPEIVSGRSRQVDASIRSKVGTSPILVIVECRKRGRAADKTWFEQLKTKKEDLGAHTVLAVTQKPVGPSAQEAAKRYGIEVRCLRSLGPDEAVQIKTDIPGLTMSVKNIRAIVDYDYGRPIGVSVVFIDADTSIKLDPAINKALSKDPWNTPFLFDRGGGNGLTVKRIVDEAHRRGWNPVADAPIGVECKPVLRISLTDEWYSSTTTGHRRVSGVEIVYQTKRVMDGVDLNQHAYVGLTGLTQVADGGIAIPGGNEFKITFAIDDGGVRSGIEQVEPKNGR